MGFALLACNEPKEKEVLDLGEIMPSSEREYNDTNAVTVDDVQERIENYFALGGMKFDEVGLLSDKLFPGRFGPDSTFSAALNIEGQAVSYYRWLYSDSVKTTNAFYNWIDCFGTECKSIFVGDEVPFQREAMQLLVNDTVIIYVSADKLDFEQWTRFHEALGYEKDWNYIIEQKPRGKARWFRYEEDKKIKFAP